MSVLKEIYSFRVVSAHLATAGQPTESELAEVAAAGFEVVVNLGLAGAPYALPDEAATVAALGLDYAHLPVSFEAPAPEDLERFCALMDSLDGRRTFVHCAANKRVSVLVALWQLRAGRWDGREAEDFIASVWLPTPPWQRLIKEAVEWSAARPFGT